MGILNPQVGEICRALYVGRGSAAQPSLAFEARPTTGFFLESDDEIGIAIAGVLALSLGAGGVTFEGNLAWQSDTAFVMTLDHDATVARTITFPDATDTVVLLDATQTLTGKTLTGNVAVTLVSGAATLTLPTATGTLATLAGTEVLTNKTLTGNIAVTLVSGAATVTLPTTTATLATLALSETLTNKTLTSPSMTTATITSGGLAITAGAVTGLKNNPFIDAAGNDTLTVARSGEVIIANEAATQSYALPAATNAGVTFTFVCGNAGGQIELNPDGADTVSLLTDDSGTAITSTATTGTVLNTAATNVAGDTLTIVADGVSRWYMISQNGIWSVT